MKRRPFLTARERIDQRVTIGFAGIADFRSIIGQEYIAGVTEAAADYGVNLINFAGAIKYSLSGDIDFLEHYAKKYRFMRPNIIDGLVTWASSLSVFLSYDAIVQLHEKLKPLPMVDLGVPVLSEVPGVTVQAAQGIRLIMEHLANEHGYTRFGFVGCSDGRQYQGRLDAWREELRRHGWEEDPDKVGILDSLEPKDIGRWVETLCQRFDLRGRKEIDALVTVSDVAAATLLEELQQRGIRVPRDVAVTGFNNQIQSVGAVCPVTTVDLGYFRRGYAAVEMLLDRIEYPDQLFETQIVESTLVIRQSCGCFETEVTTAGTGTIETWGGRESPADLRLHLVQGLTHMVPGLSPLRREEIAETLCHDLKTLQGRRWLEWLQQTLALDRPLIPERLSEFQNLVSAIRRIALPALPDDQSRQILEGILHQARVMLSLANVYYERSHRTDAYRFNNLARIAISFASARTVTEILDAVRFHLGELEMPGILLVLQDEALPDLGGGHLELVHPPTLHETPLPLRVHEAAFIPRSVFPRDRPWAMMFEVLSVSGLYLGYALIEMGPLNVALYDAVRTLLSHSLVAVYSREGRTSRLRERLLGSEPVSSILAHQPDEPAGRLGFTSHRIVHYLMDHLADMTDLDVMSAELSISKSYLIRRTKALTGHTVQALHELLKVERAKVLLETRSLKIGDIAAQVGYQNPSYFAAVFKKNTGVSPKEWLRRRD